MDAPLMRGSTLRTTVRDHDEMVIIDLTGEIDGTGEKTLDAAYAEAVGRNPRRVLLNFAGVQYINSTGIALIVGLLGRAQRARLPLTACGLSEHYQEIFRITRLADFVSIFPDEESALKS